MAEPARLAFDIYLPHISFCVDYSISPQLWADMCVPSSHRSLVSAIGVLLVGASITFLVKLYRARRRFMRLAKAGMVGSSRDFDVNVLKDG